MLARPQLRGQALGCQRRAAACRFAGRALALGAARFLAFGAALALDATLALGAAFLALGAAFLALGAAFLALGAALALPDFSSRASDSRLRRPISSASCHIALPRSAPC